MATVKLYLAVHAENREELAKFLKSFVDEYMTDRNCMGDAYLPSHVTYDYEVTETSRVVESVFLQDLFD